MFPVIASLFITSSALAQQSPNPLIPTAPVNPLSPESTFNRHRGFFIRPEIGIGYASGTESTTQGDLTVSGMAGTASINIGGAVAENTIIGVHLFDAVLTNPTVTLNGQTASTSSVSYTMFGIGPSFTYYFMPANLYWSGTVAITTLNATVNGRSYNAQTGWGFRTSLGKEWWVSEHWGLGVSGSLSYSANADTGTNAPTIGSYLGAISFSATFN
jgi:hypothetical protein